MQNSRKSSLNSPIFIYRLSAFSLTLITYIFLQILIKTIFFFDSKPLSFVLKRKMTKLAMNIFGVEMKIKGQQKSSGCFIAANHSSTVDILLLLQVAKPIFITSVEVRESFLTGIITKLSDTVFVERRTKASVRNDAGRIGQMIRNGDSICLFPEGTSSDGTKLLKFKSSLFQSVAKSGIKVQPISIKYYYSPEFKGPKMAGYYGDMTFVQHIFNLCQPGKIKVRMNFCEQFSTEEKDRKEICSITEERIREKFENQ